MLQSVASSLRGCKKKTKGLESSGSTCPAGVSVRFASLVGLRHSYQNAQTTGPDSVLRSHGRWAERTAHRPFLARESPTYGELPMRKYACDRSLFRVTEGLWVSKGNTSRPCALAARCNEPWCVFASRFPSRPVLGRTASDLGLEM